MSDFREHTRGFGGNTLPPKAGRVGMPTDWTCVCGNHNSGRNRWTQRGEEICRQCMQPRKFVEDHGSS